MRFKKYLKIRYLIILFLLLLTFFNKTAIKIFKNQLRYYELNHRIKALKKDNAEFEKRLYYLENKPSYLERKAKFELNVIAEDEVEYRFSNSETETKKK